MYLYVFVCRHIDTYIYLSVHLSICLPIYIFIGMGLGFLLFKLKKTSLHFAGVYNSCD